MPYSEMLWYYRGYRVNIVLGRISQSQTLSDGSEVPQVGNAAALMDLSLVLKKLPSVPKRSNSRRLSDVV